MRHVGGAHFYAVALCVLHQLRRAVKAQRLAVKHGSQKAGRLMPFKPATEVDQDGKACGVTFGKAVFTKTFHLPEYGMRKLLRIAIFHHAFNHPVLVFLYATVAFPGGHGTAQAIGLPGREVGSNNRNLHHLLLKNRHSMGARKHFLQPGVRGLGFLRVFARLQIRVHHAALDGSRTHDGHLHDQVIKHSGPQARQHAHLRTAFNLEYAYRVGLANHVVGGLVFTWHILHAHGAWQFAPLRGQRQAAA